MKPVKYVLKAVAKTEHRRRMKARAMKTIEGKSPNMLAAELGTSKAFYLTPQWKALRQLVLDKYGRKCMKCGFVPSRFGQFINVDHIKPRVYFPELAWDFDNLQVLCEQCNTAKGNKHCTDYRPRLAA